jgi:hypothetical protein
MSSSPEESAAKRKQFLVVSAVVAAMLGHAFVSAGGFHPVEVGLGIFPGGEFLYKYAIRDYAASPSLVEWVASDAQLPVRDMVDRVYALYFDDPRGMAGTHQRFAAGYLATDKASKEVHKNLLEKDSKNAREDVTDEEMRTMAVTELWPQIKYESASLPSVNCGIAHFPFTNGFISALLLQYKVIPALLRYASEHMVDKPKAGTGVGPVVLTTCSVSEAMCTYYVPLVKTRRFHVGGRPDGDAYRKSLKAQDFELIDWEGLRKSLRKYFPGATLIL